jgi:hypothetical protein
MRLLMMRGNQDAAVGHDFDRGTWHLSAENHGHVLETTFIEVGKVPRAFF